MLTSRRMLQVRENTVMIVTLVTLKAFAGHLSVCGQLFSVRYKCQLILLLCKPFYESKNFLKCVKIISDAGFFINTSFTFIQQDLLNLFLAMLSFSLMTTLLKF